ncbi:hypothetical protein DFH09DRAFT_336502 [Mycena vulgaris]|nr:hypothetical protein DFH09DRAFT_336502 [Mycena vulgaris]
MGGAHGMGSGLGVGYLVCPLLFHTFFSFADSHGTADRPLVNYTSLPRNMSFRCLFQWLRHDACHLILVNCRFAKFHDTFLYDSASAAHYHFRLDAPARILLHHKL